MKNSIWKSLFYCILLLGSFHSFATHIVGAEMTYKNVGANTFEFTLNLYRDCEGIPVAPVYRIDYSTVNCNIQGNFTVTMDPTLTREISPVCPGLPTICNGGTIDGIQQFVYKGTFTLPQACTDWTFSWRECNRNQDITTILNPNAQCLYIESKLNSVATPTNNSPTFNNPPVSLLCTNQINNINPGTAETDGDDMVFSSVIPKTGKIQTITYLSPYSATNPVSSLSPFQVNATNGDMILNPSQENEVTVTAIKVEEYRNGVLIGSTIRDMQLLTKNCQNNNPVLSGINGTNSNSITICAGNQVCFDIFGSDPDPGQILSMTWDQAIPYDDFIISGDETTPKARYCWKTDLSDVGLHFFTVTLKDNFCPTTGITVKSYNINVVSGPEVTSPTLISIPCNSDTLITPVISNGISPFFYRWDNGVTTASNRVNGGSHTVTITDGRGCRSVTTYNVNSGIQADFDFTKQCSLNSANFSDQSVTSSTAIVDWQWNFGDPGSGINNTSTTQNPSHVFSSQGVFNVRLIATDDAGCKDTITKVVTNCGTPIANFSTVDSCQDKPYIYIRDQSTSNCGLSQISVQFGALSDGRNFSNGSLYFPPGGIVFPFVQPVSGWVNIQYTVRNPDGCTHTINRPFKIAEKPEININQSSYYYRCNRPDTVLTATINTSKGKAPYQVQWSTGSTTLTTNKNGYGLVTINITDANGCMDNDIIAIAYPLAPNFTASPYCQKTDTIQLTEATTSHWTPILWEWDFGDGTTFTTSNPALKSPKHFFAPYSKYQVTLRVSDNTTCSQSYTKEISTELPDTNFVVTPTPFCIGQTLQLETPRGISIDSLVWDMGNGTTFKRPYFPPPSGPLQSLLVYPSAPAVPQYYHFNTNYTYPSGSEGNSYTVSLRMNYNKSCVKNFSKSVSIFPAFDVEIDSIRGKQCSGDTVNFYASQKIGSPAISWNWRFYYQENTPPYNKTLVGTSTDQNPRKTFTQGGNYYANLRAVNADGCEEVISDYGFSVVELPKPVFCIDNPCANQLTKFFYFCSSFPEVSIDSIRWDFGDGSTVNIQEPFHTYADSGIYNVTCEIYNTNYGCKNDTTIPTRIYNLPIPDFTAQDVCLGQEVHFTDLSIAPTYDTLYSWNWNFGNGQSFSTTNPSEKNPSHLYADTGSYNVSLVVQSKVSNCTNTITKTVHVRPNPIAGFTYTENELVLNRPVLFIDQSTGAVKWLWRFGDGDSLVSTDIINKNVEHTYRGALKTVTIHQTVYNEYNCIDTISKTIDLTIHLVVPNAFSPNGDGKNDFFNLFYKGIESLQQFTIFNRWGEKIFDGSGDLNSAWDGKYKGEDQPLGSYVYYIKARNFAGEDIALSGKIILIR